MAEFKRPIQEVYGPSSVRLEKLDTGNKMVTLNINGRNILLPVLDVNRYDPNIGCYAFIERMEQYPITMVDVIYTYEDIYNKFENDESFRKDFLKLYSRTNLNTASLKTPVMTLVPNGSNVQKLRFVEAMKSAIQDAIGSNIMAISSRTDEDVKVEIAKDPSTVRQDGIVVEFIKDFYEIISGTRVKRPTDPQVETVRCSITRDAIIMKNGAMIVSTEEISKYFTNFRAELSAPQPQKVTDRLAIHISGVNDLALRNNPEYLQQFGDILLSSNILETLLLLNAEKAPKLEYVGRYNPDEKKLEVNKKVERYIDQINDLIVPSKGSEGR